MKRIIDIDKPTFDDIIAANSITGHLGRVDWCIRNSNPYEERPQGEWIVKQERAGAFVGDRAVYSYTCPFCKVKEFAKYPFCHCGADMRGGRE